MGVETYNILNYKRRETTPVYVGGVQIGGGAPVCVQSMANTDTNDTKASAEQCVRIAEAGGQLVRFTAQGVKEAANLALIKEELGKMGCSVPLVADIHFNPKAADEAALHVEKVRVNPGNYVDSVHTQRRFEYTDEEYAKEIEKIRERFVPFLNICKEHKTAIRIGVNHGSLSDRILSRYGDTPEGMVESCLEFLRICKEEEFNNVVISIKASNTVIMVRTVRMLVQKMESEGMKYPLHLGVTEAGDGEDGRVKSAVGIGALLTDGIGDTIRVSLSEAPEAEIPVARMLADYVEGKKRVDADETISFASEFNSLWDGRKKRSKAVGICGGDNVPVVVSRYSMCGGMKPDFLMCDKPTKTELKQIVPFSVYNGEENVFPLFGEAEFERIKGCGAKYKFVRLEDYAELEKAKEFMDEDCVVMVMPRNGGDAVWEMRAVIANAQRMGMDNPVVLAFAPDAKDLGELQIKCGADGGAFFIDGLADGVMIESQMEESLSVSFTLLQAARARVSKTEYISCPSCGRTLYNLQEAIAEIKAATSHLTGLKIGIMGCIVNGPGEMADADYGYVGAGRGKINLYKKQECVEKSIPQELAVAKLIDLIKKNGDWKERE